MNGELYRTEFVSFLEISSFAFHRRNTVAVVKPMSSEVFVFSVDVWWLCLCPSDKCPHSRRRQTPNVLSEGDRWGCEKTSRDADVQTHTHTNTPKRLLDYNLHLDGCTVTSSTVKNLGVILDSNLSFENHISHVTKTAFFHLRNIAKLWTGFPVAQMVEHGASNAKIMGSIPRDSKSWSNVKL